MTRGTAYAVFNDCICVTDEFNGDMYLSGHGTDLINYLLRVDSKTDFNIDMNEFNAKNFRYEDFQVFESPRKVFGMEDNNFFALCKIGYISDFNYIKNLSEKEISVATDEEIFHLDVGGILVTSYDCRVVCYIKGGVL